MIGATEWDFEIWITCTDLMFKSVLGCHNKGNKEGESVTVHAGWIGEASD